MSVHALTCRDAGRCRLLRALKLQGQNGTYHAGIETEHVAWTSSTYSICWRGSGGNARHCQHGRDCPANGVLTSLDGDSRSRLGYFFALADGETILQGELLLTMDYCVFLIPAQETRHLMDAYVGAVCVGGGFAEASGRNRDETLRTLCCPSSARFMRGGSRHEFGLYDVVLDAPG